MKKVYLLIITITLLGSCQKDDKTTAKVSYLPLGIGNYWIYQYVDIDSSGHETELSKSDSVVINRDTIINHKRYFVFEGTNNPFAHAGYRGIVDILRDSSGYIVNPEGIIRFAENDFKDSIAYRAEVSDNDTLYTITYRMAKINNAITVPAGTFYVLNYKGTCFTPLSTPGVKYPRNLNCYYAQGIGNILYTYFYIGSPNIYEKRLLRYKINN